MQGGVRLDADDMESLKLQDLEDISNETRYVNHVSPMVNSSGQAIYGANNTPTTIYGVNTDYLEIRRYKVPKETPSPNRTYAPPRRSVSSAKRLPTSSSPTGALPSGR